MTEDQMDKILASHMGHVWVDDCNKCPRERTCSGFNCGINPDYFTERGFFTLWDWACSKPWWGFLGDDIYQELINPTFFATALCKYLMYLDEEREKDGASMEEIEKYFRLVPILGDVIDIETVRSYDEQVS
jgi:hypothetical protein